MAISQQSVSSVLLDAIKYLNRAVNGVSSALYIVGGESRVMAMKGARKPPTAKKGVNHVKLLTLKDVGHILGIGDRTARQMKAQLAPGQVIINRRIKYRADFIDQFILSGGCRPSVVDESVSAGAQIVT